MQILANYMYLYRCILSDALLRWFLSIALRILLCMFVRSNEHIHNFTDSHFPLARLDSKINARFLLNEHSELYFLLHNNSVQVILFNLKKGEKFYSKEKEIWLKARTKPLL